MKWRVSVSVALLGAPLSRVTFADELELALPCSVCSRNDRTVIIKLRSPEGICAKTAHPFEGSLVGLKTLNVDEEARAIYQVEYEFAPFVDKKYREPAEAVPGWARVGFNVRCPKCLIESKRSTQTNLRRPLAVRCGCGATLYQELDTMPRIEAEAIRSS